MRRSHAAGWRGIPTSHADWHFVRCGRKGYPYAERLAQQLRDLGWEVAPASVWLRLPEHCQLAFGESKRFDPDGDGLYLCIDHAGYEAIKARKMRLREQRSARSDDTG